MRNWPLKLRLVLWTLLVGGLSVALFGGLIGHSVATKMRNHLDSTLRREAESVFEGVAQLGHPMNWADPGEVSKLFSAVYSLYSFEIEVPPGKLVYRSRELGDIPLPKGPEGVAYTGVVSTTDTVRVLQLTKEAMQVRVAVDVSPFTEWERSIWWTYATILPIAFALLAWGAHWLYGKALKPVDDIVAAAEHITADRLDQRLPVSGSLDEIGHLTAVLNRMIDRLQQSFEQARRFSADASHELKTPLTIIRGELEIALRSGDVSHAVEKTMLDLLDETGRLVHIVEGLLLLSQADAGKFPVGADPIALTELIEELAEDIEILGDRLEIGVKLQLATGVRVKGSPQFLRQLVMNLFDNAIKYNEPNGTIRCELTTAGGMAVFRIANTGADIPPGDRERIFNRFFRVESSRARTDVSGGGQGLGLSIAREIVRAHGGALTLEPSEPGWTIFQFTIPLCDSAQVADAKRTPATAKASA
jgi:signal transduction histidine kinase